MEFKDTALPEVKLIIPKVHGDSRGYFYESYRQDLFEKSVRPIRFVQDNQSLSSRGTLRGLHYQLPPFAQSKLVRVARGAVIDVAVDIREGSPTFGKSVAVELTESNHYQLFIPRGFAHGFLALTDNALLQYKVDNPYSKESEGGIRFDDPDLAIDWKATELELTLSDKDRVLPFLKDARLFQYGKDLYER